MKQTWIKLIAESVLIIFSVLLAFWIDNKTKGIEDKKLKEELTSRIYIDIQSDSTNFLNYLRNRKRVENYVNTLIEYANSGNITVDSLAVIFIEIEWFASYQTNNSTYSSIINSGQLKLFERDTLFLNISSYYNHNNNIIGLTQAYLAGANRFLVPYLNDHFDRRLFDKTKKQFASPIDLNKFRSKEFFNILYSLTDRLIDERFLNAHSNRQLILLEQIRKSR